MKNLFKALAAFQNEVPIIHKDTTGYGYTYADLPKIIETINPLLKKHGLGYTQPIGKGVITTIVFHIESGESIESEVTIPEGVNLKGMNEFQVLGSAITYLRRYSLSSVLGLVTDKDTNAAGESQPKKYAEVLNKSTLSDMVKDTISRCEDVGALEAYYKICDHLHKNTEFLQIVSKRKKELNGLG